MQTQTWYFFFQLIQVFLITTFSSGATSVASQIVSQPSSAVILLAKNLPKASNFYIAYFVLQGLLMSCRNLIRPIPLIKEVRRHFKAKSPRKRFNRYMKLSDVKWGSKYPKFANLGVIAISYSCIAPLMLGFATVGMALIYIAARYNAIYVYDTKIDTKGAAYARALQHLTVGVYISELCLIGLFAIRAGDSLISIAPLALMVMFLVATGLWHLTMRKAVEPLTRHLPRNLLLETAEAYDDIEAASLLTHGNHPAQSTDNLHSIHIVNGSSLSHCRSNVNSQRTSDGTSNGIHHAPSNLNNIFEYSPHYNPSDASTRRGSRMFAFFQPQKDTAVNISARLDPSFHEPVPHYSQELAREAYLHPAVKAKPPKLWIVRDEMGISQREINEIREKIPRLDISDDGAHFDEKGKIVVDVETWRDAPLWEPKMRIKY